MENEVNNMEQRKAECLSVPVSYTHLDVYKRQDTDSLILLSRSNHSISNRF